MSDDDNTPYRETAAYRDAAAAAAVQNFRQRRAAKPVSHFPDEPWLIPEINVICQEVFTAQQSSEEKYATSPRYLASSAARRVTFEVSWSHPSARRALLRLKSDKE